MLRITRVHDATQPFRDCRDERVVGPNLVDARRRIRTLTSRLAQKVRGAIAVLRQNRLACEFRQHHRQPTGGLRSLLSLDCHRRRDDKNPPNPRERRYVRAGSAAITQLVSTVAYVTGGADGCLRRLGRGTLQPTTVWWASATSCSTRLVCSI